MGVEKPLRGGSPGGSSCRMKLGKTASGGRLATVGSG